MRIIYTGTPGYAIPPLKAILASGHEVPLVVTRPDARKGRGRKKSAPPVKKAAISQDIEVFQPSSINSEESVHRLEAADPDLLLVCSFGEILQQEVLEVPERGALNVHPSLLPRYRGAAPVAHTLLNGDEETGITIFRMEEEVDSGPIIEQVRTEIHPHEDREELRERLFELAAEVLPGVLKDMEERRIRLATQDDEEATDAPVLSKEDGRIDWGESAVKIRNRVRAVQPWPGAYTWLHMSNRGDTMRMNIIQGRELPGAEESGEEGKIVEVGKKGIMVGTADGLFAIRKLQPENSRVMEAMDFINGYQPQAGDQFLTEPPEEA